MIGCLPRRKETILQDHPLYGRVILKSDLPSLANIARAAWKLPRPTSRWQSFAGAASVQHIGPQLSLVFMYNPVIWIALFMHC